MLPKEAVVRLQVQMSLTHWIPVITILKEFHGGAFNSFIHFFIFHRSLHRYNQGCGNSSKKYI
jgi:hypothetical protein